MATTFCPSRQAARLGERRCVQRASRHSRSLACSATEAGEKLSFAKAASSTAAAAALAAVVSLGSVDVARADIAGLTPCRDSPQYAKKQKKEISGLQNRMKKVNGQLLVSFLMRCQYEEGSAPALALQATIDKTNKRFAFYAKNNLLCGKDGLPHLIADPGYAFKFGHAGEIMIPTLLFIYIAGHIGYTGRLYLEQTKSTAKEYIIDVPLALNCFFKALGWPLSATTELISGTLLEKDENITVSPR